MKIFVLIIVLLFNSCSSKEVLIENNQDKIIQVCYIDYYDLPSLRFHPKSLLLIKDYSDELAIIITKYKERKEEDCVIQISAHTDSNGGTEENLKLTKKQAQIIKDSLIAKGIEPRLIKTFGYGETRPLTSTLTEASRLLNRRVEFRFVKTTTKQ